jgi:hypothetical protein
VTIYTTVTGIVTEPGQAGDFFLKCHKAGAFVLRLSQGVHENGAGRGPGLLTRSGAGGIVRAAYCEGRSRCAELIASASVTDACGALTSRTRFAAHGGERGALRQARCSDGSRWFGGRRVGGEAISRS